MHEIQLAGTHEELGRAYGKYVAERKLHSWWRVPSPRELAFAKACEEAIAEHAPGYLDELRALAAATDTDYDVVLFNLAVIYLAENTACNVVAVSGNQTANGHTVFARNHDWEDEDIDYVTCFRTSPTDGLRNMGFGFADPGRYDGVNEAGLAVGGSSIPFYKGTSGSNLASCSKNQGLTPTPRNRRRTRGPSAWPAAWMKWMRSANRYPAFS